ncbi:nicotinamidase/pyrazinamidase [Vibrio aerogenes CECT 7868]|uniref:Nicotinamidase n=1 Tax=Vibrio aerogenes CECT 7868 TaxID=1216006 RepID=A0A1M6DZJ6_9VIBR|nr:bifunctional nicotinamidase/pyrazinamidase [Vibrio aerogenes]SHI78694.1 nicotinamidase/pyrazinamidase [Vibrio aerogenes CECT 7868]
MNKTLIIVDVQNDFSSEGALAVPEGEAVVPVINQIMPFFDFIIATKDWHPEGHASFASSHQRTPGDVIDLDGIPQILWPDHCVQGTKGADFIEGLDTDRINSVIYKGTDPGIDSYSSFFDNHKQKSTGLADLLISCDKHELYIVGLATDYCVQYTALDAVSLGFKTYVIQDACRGVNQRPGDDDVAFYEMSKAGCLLILSSDLPLNQA